MPKQDYYKEGQLTDLAYLILVSLVKPCHGYMMMARVEEMTGGQVRIGPASLYTTLKRLTEAGFIRLLEDNSVKKVYGITEAGMRALTVEIEKRERYAMYGRQAIAGEKGELS